MACIHANCIATQVDVTSPSAVEAAMAQVASEYGSIEMLVQAAGITGVTGVMCHEVDPDYFDLVQAINVKVSGR